MSKSTPVVLTVADWNTASHRYMQPKINDRGGKSISLISTQTNRSLHISTPLMMTWGIADFVDEKGESDGKYNISLNFPMNASAVTDDFLKKLKDFENQILDDAVKYSDAWFGEEMSREVAKHTFFPFLKYSKDKATKKIDPAKPPSIRAKVSNYNSRWGVEIYDTKGSLIFPCDNENMTPMDFVPKKSNVACVLQCGGIWFGGKGWGLTWKLNQCVVKPQENVSVYGKCHIMLSSDDVEAIEKQEVAQEADEEDDVETPAKATAPSTIVEDSDDEKEADVLAPEPAVVPTVKKVIKKVAPETPAAAAESAVAVASEVAPTAAAAPVKKVLKKKV